MTPTLLLHVLRKYYFNTSTPRGVVQCQNIHTKFHSFLIHEFQWQTRTHSTVTLRHITHSLTWTDTTCGTFITFNTQCETPKDGRK